MAGTPKAKMAEEDLGGDDIDVYLEKKVNFVIKIRLSLCSSEYTYNGVIFPLPRFTKPLLLQFCSQSLTLISGKTKKVPHDTDQLANQSAGARDTIVITEEDSTVNG